MRTTFIEVLIEKARTNDRIFLIVGDLGFSVVEPFFEEFPDRFLNAGVAEQNMTGIAAGLASEGFHVFTYSIANFPTLRCLEQVRNDVCYHDLPVTIVAVGTGMAYGSLGYSHHGVQDIAVMRGLPNITVLSPSDQNETCAAVNWIVDHPKPTYLRLGKAVERRMTKQASLHKKPSRVITHAGEHAIVASGSILSEALEASVRLRQMDFLVDVFSCPWLAPVTADTFSELTRYKKIFVVEEHVRHGGVGEMLAILLSGRTVVESISVPMRISNEVGSQDRLRVNAGLDSRSICARIAGCLKS